MTTLIPPPTVAPPRIVLPPPARHHLALMPSPTHPSSQAPGESEPLLESNFRVQSWRLGPLRPPGTLRRFYHQLIVDLGEARSLVSRAKANAKAHQPPLREAVAAPQSTPAAALRGHV